MHVGALAEQVDDEDSIIRHHASLCLGKLVSTMASPDDGSDPDPTSRMKEFFAPYLLGSDDNIVCALHCVCMYVCIRLLLNTDDFIYASGPKYMHACMCVSVYGTNR